MLLLLKLHHFRLVVGDIPCTPETEPSYSYTWNFCQDITSVSVPKACQMMKKKNAVALQSIYLSDSSYDCYMFGTYDPDEDDLHYSLLDPKDPSRGISMKYPNGEVCTENHQFRSATIDVMCANTKLMIVSAQEPTHCQYHLVMKSYHGCPSECPVTSMGLCSSHGHCSYDFVNEKSYCYCNDGYGGDDCSQKVKSGTVGAYDGHSVQLGLMVTLIVLTVLLIGVVGYMYFKIKDYRREQQMGSSYSSHSMHAEMVETVHF